MAPCACAWITQAAIRLGEEPPVAEPGHVAGLAWFDRLIAALLHQGHLERVTVAAGEPLTGRDGPVEVTPGAPVLVVDPGGRGYLVRARQGSSSC